MKKSKFILLILALIVFLGFSLILFPAEVNGAGGGGSGGSGGGPGGGEPSEPDVEDHWTAAGLPLSAMNFVDEDGKGIKFYVSYVSSASGSPYNLIFLKAAQNYYFDDGEILTGQGYFVRNILFSSYMLTALSYYVDTYGSNTIPEWDRIIVCWNVEQQMFVEPDFLTYWFNRYDELEDQVEKSFNEGWNEGYGEGYYEGYDEGHIIGYDEGYDEAYNEAYPGKVILLITLIMYILAMFLYFKFNIRWILIATILLWFVPIFLVQNLFVKIFCIIMIIVTIVITFFNDREEEYLE